LSRGSNLIKRRERNEREKSKQSQDKTPSTVGKISLLSLASLSITAWTYHLKREAEGPQEDNQPSRVVRLAIKPEMKNEIR